MNFITYKTMKNLRALNNWLFDQYLDRYQDTIFQVKMLPYVNKKIVDKNLSFIHNYNGMKFVILCNN